MCKGMCDVELLERILERYNMKICRARRCRAREVIRASRSQMGHNRKIFAGLHWFPLRIRTALRYRNHIVVVVAIIARRRRCRQRWFCSRGTRPCIDFLRLVTGQIGLRSFWKAERGRGVAGGWRWR